MAFCGSCGAQMQDGAAKCPACGAVAGAPAAVAASGGSGITDNVAAALVYFPFFIGLVLAIIFLLIEPYNKKRLVRFHAFQSLFLVATLFVLGICWQILIWILALITHGLALLLYPISLLFLLGILALLIFLAIQAYGNKEYKLPFIGDLAAKQAGA